MLCIDDQEQFIRKQYETIKAANIQAYSHMRYGGTMSQTTVQVLIDLEEDTLQIMGKLNTARIKLLQEG